jgi:biotin carboxyl carrier protein
MTNQGGMTPLLATLVGVGVEDGTGALTVDPATAEARFVPTGDGHGILESPGGRRGRVLVLPVEPTPAGKEGRAGSRRVEVVVEGWRFEVDLEPAARAALRKRATRSRDAGGERGPVEVRAIIPGVVVSVAVAAGDRVVAGQQLLAVEAMKMQNELRAPRDGTIERVAAAPGRTIEVGDLLVVIA